MELPSVPAAVVLAAIQWTWVGAVVATIAIGLWSDRRAAPPTIRNA